MELHHCIIINHHAYLRRKLHRCEQNHHHHHHHHHQDFLTSIIFLHNNIKVMIIIVSITIVAMVMGGALSCPIDMGCESLLPNTTTYIRQSLDTSNLQLSVNISTTRGHAFRPQGFPPALFSKNMDGPTLSSNGCEGKYNFTSSDTGVETPCPWSYQCDYDPQRIPAFIFHAHCDSATPQGEEFRDTSMVCNEVHYPVSYVMTESCDTLEDGLDGEWNFKTSILPVACNLRDLGAEM